MELRVWSNQNSTCFCWQIAVPHESLFANVKRLPKLFQWLVECMTWIPIQIIYGRGHLRIMQYKTTRINDSALILFLGCLWAKCKIYWGQLLYLFLFSVVSSLSAWGCFSCCCGRDLTLFFSAAVAWVLSILLKIMKQHAIETDFFIE